MKKYIGLIFVVIVAGFLRLYQLGVVPPSPDWDEAALGYNAYSILKTGKDEYGNFFPLSIRSFDDYKPPLYTYLTVPSVGLFGLNTWSTRLPSALMGILAVIGTYFLAKELFSSSKIKDLRPTTLPLLSALLLAISPWHIQFSRIAFEANSGITINIWAVACFFIGLRKKSMLVLSAFLFGLGMYAYHSERVFLPLLVLLLLIVYRKIVFQNENKKFLILSLIVGILTVLPLVSVFSNKTSMLRLQGTSSFSNQTELLSRNITKISDDQKAKDYIGLFLDNRRFIYVNTLISGYLSHFSLKWLFLTGDNPRHHAPDMGLLYLWELPFLLFGLYYLLRPTTNDLRTKFLLGWILIAPIAASPTTGLPHAIRTLVFLPVFQIITALGIIFVGSAISNQQSAIKRVWTHCLLFIVYCFVFFNVSYYVVQYFVVMNREYSEFWQYGYKETVRYTESVKGNYEKVVVSTGLEQSYIFFLFYTKYDPVKYLSQGGTKSGSFAESRNSFDTYLFRPLDWKNEIFDGKTLYVGFPTEMPHGNNAHILFLDGSPAIEIKDKAY